MANTNTQNENSKEEMRKNYPECDVITVTQLTPENLAVSGTPDLVAIGPNLSKTYAEDPKGNKPGDTLIATQGVEIPKGDNPKVYSYEGTREQDRAPIDKEGQGVANIARETKDSAERKYAENNKDGKDDKNQGRE